MVDFMGWEGELAQSGCTTAIHTAIPEFSLCLIRFAAALSRWLHVSPESAMGSSFAGLAHGGACHKRGKCKLFSKRNASNVH